MANNASPSSESPVRRSRAKVALCATAVLAVAGLVLVFALPGAPARKYPDRIPVRMWHMWTAEWKDVVDKICQRFNESQSVYEILPLSVPMTSADSKFLLAVAGGDPPDVMAQWNPVIPKWAESGLIVPLDSLMTPAEYAQFQRDAYPAVKKIGMYKGRLYGVTTGLNVFACYARLDHLREAGLYPGPWPKSLEDLFAWSDQLHRRDSRGQLTRIGLYLLQYNFYTLPAFGGGYYDWNRGQVVIDTPENLRACQYLYDQRKRLGFDNVIRFQSGLAIGLGNVEWPFISGAYSIALDGQWRVEQIARYAPDLEYATFPLPPPQGGKEHASYTNGNFMIIPVGAHQPRGAWEFIKFWSGLDQPERAAEFYTWGGWLPLSPAIAEAPIFRQYVRDHPQFQTFLDVLPSENVQPTPPVPYQVYLWDRVIRTDEAVLRGQITPEAAIARLSGDVKREVASRREFGYAE